MSILVLAPPKILLQTLAADWAAVTGGNATLFTDSAEKQHLSNHLQNVFQNIEFFDQFNANAMVEKRAIALHKIHPFTNVIALAESDVLRAAQLRERFKIGGMPPNAAILFRDKYEMKKCARSKGVSVTDFRLIDNPLNLLDFVDQVGYPFVVKPVDGRGSAGVRVIHDENALNIYLASGAVNRKDSPLVEAFVPGTMYQANGLYLNGKCALISTVQCINSNLDFLNGTYLGLKMLAANNPLRDRLFVFTRHLLENVLPMPPTGLFHIEIFHTPDDQLLLCEAACRLAGCIANDQIKAAFGVDIRLEYMRSECLPDYVSPLLQHPQPESRLIGELNIPPNSGILKSIPEICPLPWVEFYKNNGNLEKKYDKMAFTNGEIASFLVNGNSEQELEQRLHETASWFNQSTIWATA